MNVESNHLFQKNMFEVLRKKKIALFIVAYNAEDHIYKTLKRLPKNIRNKFVEIYLIDDSSSDNTLSVSLAAAKKLGIKNFKAMKTPFNLGYGGNQKVGYAYAIKKEYDYVIMLHADGQYAPEFLPQFINCTTDIKIAAVFGSRMVNRYEALKGGMPLYKWFGNRILNLIENIILGSRLSEFHSGYRMYAVSSLRAIPFSQNSDNFHFDTDIIIQLFEQGSIIKEIPIPTFYGNEVCHVNGYKYAFNCIKSAVKYRLYKMNIFYQANFDIERVDKRNYSYKNNKNTLHYFIAHLRALRKTDLVIDLGAGEGLLARMISKRVRSVIAVDIAKPDQSNKVKALQLDLNGNFDKHLGLKQFDKVISLDLIEHLNSPEDTIRKINNILKNKGQLYVSTANIAYILMRVTLLLGWFNYGKRGILDRTHKRLFTVGTFKRLLKNNGFKVKKIIGFGPPIADSISNKGIFLILDRLSGYLARAYPRLFSFNFLVIAEKKVSFQEIFGRTLLTRKR